MRQVARRVETLALVLVTSLRKPGCRLWREQAATGRLVQIDSSLSPSDSAGSSVPHPPIDLPDDTRSIPAGRLIIDDLQATIDQALPRLTLS